jgi:hypothetical protein
MTVIDNERKGRVRQAVRRYRRRRQHGIYHRPIDITDAQLNARFAFVGAVAPPVRIEITAFFKPVEMFLMDSLTKPR